MSIHPEKRTLDAIKLLSKASKDWPLSMLVLWIMAESGISRATAYRIVKNHLEKKS